MTNAFESRQHDMGESQLADIFGTGSDNVLMPTEVDTESQELAARVLKNDTLEKTLDGVPEEAKKKKDEEKEKQKQLIENTKVEQKPVDKNKANEVLNSIVEELNITETAEEKEKAKSDTSTGGRPKSEKSAFVSYLKDKIEANDFGLPGNIEYDDSKQTLEDVLSKLSEKDLHGILDTNWKAKEDELRAQTPKEFFDSLPEELQYAAAYVAEGGQDMKSLFAALSKVEEVKSLDPKNEDHQAIIAKSYLQAKGFGSEDAIAEQIEEWKENGKLGKKANEFKPALDDMQKEQVQAQIRVAEEQKKQQQELAKFYSTNVYQTLEKNELAGVKMDKKFARDLGNNMTTTVPGPYSGRPVNYLGYGLEKAQYTNPDYEAVMIAAWVLNDKEAALAALSQSGANKKAEEVAKLIKLNQGLGKTGGEQVQINEPSKVRRLKYNTDNVLKRPVGV